MKTLVTMIVGVIVALSVGFSGVVLAHEAPTDRDGCHYDWQGIKHCH